MKALSHFHNLLKHISMNIFEDKCPTHLQTSVLGAFIKLILYNII